jgi:predicted metal-dependent hydrolase
MLDWLRGASGEDPAIEVAGQMLPLNLKRNPRARRLTLRLAPDGKAVNLTVPRWTPTREAIAFASSHREWLERQLGRLPTVSPVVAGAMLPYRGEPHLLDHNTAHGRQVSREDGRIVLGGAAESLASRLERWLRKQALELMAEDLAHYCARAGQAVPALSLSSAQRRWGSCSSRGGVRMNWRLIMAPDFVRRSVVAHEVAHLVHFDHSPRFRALLDELYEADISDADAWLKRHGRSLYSHFG